MMRILYSPRRQRSDTTNHCIWCACIYEYDKSDVHHDKDGAYVNCPDCGHRNSVGE